MDEYGNHHSQQTNTGRDNQTLQVLKYKWELSNENTWTQGEEYHTAGPVRGWGPRRGIALGEMSGIGNGGMVATNHLAMNVPMQQVCMICTCTPESKVQFKKRKKKT